MINLKKIIKHLLAENEDFTLEERFYLSTLVIGVIMGFIGAVSNYFMLDSILSALIPFILSLAIICFYYFVRFKGMFKTLAFPIVILAFIGLSFIWCLNGGINGPNDIIFIILLVLGLNMVNNNNKIYVLILYITLKSILYYIQLCQPWLIFKYPSESTRWIDMLITSTYTSFIIYLTIRFLHSNYRLEHHKVESSKRELNKLNSQLQESNMTKDLFFSIISHDLKSPFNSILGFSKLIVNNIDKYDKDKIQKLSSNIYTVANETLFLLENLLKWSRIQQGILTPNFNKFVLVEIINEICSLYIETANRKGLTLRNNVADYIEVYCDEDMTKTVLRNLIANSIKFTETNGSIVISAVLKHSFVEIEVNDNGTGIPENKINQLFLGDIAISTPGTENEKGTGLGLHLCKALCEKQEGTIRVESKLGFGSSFYFTVKNIAETEIKPIF